MVNKYLVLFTFFILLDVSLLAQTTFQKVYGGVETEYVESMQLTSDLGYIISGIKLNSFTNKYDIIILRIDNVGNLVWQKTYGGINQEAAKDVQQTFDGGFIISGSSNSFGIGLNDAYLMKLDSIGVIEWSKVIGTTSSESAFSVQQTPDSGYIFGAVTNGFNGSNTDIFLIKTNGYGDTLWTRVLGDNATQTGTALRLTNDGGFVITGQSGLFGNRVYVLKTDSLGNPQWSREYGGSILDSGQDIKNTSDGGYVITGSTCFGSGNNDVYLIKTDSIGDVLWSKTYGGPDYENGLSVEQTNDGGFIVTGRTTPIPGGYNIYIIKTDWLGDTLWTKTIDGGTSTNGGCSVIETSDSGFIIASDGEFIPSNSYDIFLIKTDSVGALDCNIGNTVTAVLQPPTQVWNLLTTISSGGEISITSEISDSLVVIETTLCTNTTIHEDVTSKAIFNIYPNPSNGIFSISSPDIVDYRILIYNTYGEIIYNNQLVHSQYDYPKQIKLNVIDGIYFIKLIFNETIQCKKICIKQ